MENLQNSGLVKFVGSLFNEQVFGKWLSKILYMFNNNTFRQQAGRLLVWAITIIILATAVDMIFYWTRPEQKILITRYAAIIQKRLDSRGRK